MPDTLVILDALFAAEGYFIAEATHLAIKHRAQHLIKPPILETIQKALEELGVERGSTLENLPQLLTLEEYMKERYGKDSNSN